MLAGNVSIGFTKCLLATLFWLLLQVKDVEAP